MESIYIALFPAFPHTRAHSDLTLIITLKEQESYPYLIHWFYTSFIGIMTRATLLWSVICQLPVRCSETSILTLSFTVWFDVHPNSSGWAGKIRLNTFPKDIVLVPRPGTRRTRDLTIRVFINYYITCLNAAWMSVEYDMNCTFKLFKYVHF